MGLTKNKISTQSSQRTQIDKLIIIKYLHSLRISLRS